MYEARVRNPLLYWDYVPVPRPIRSDLQPVIWLPDTREVQQRARQAVGARYSVSVYERGATAPYVRRLDAFSHWVRFLRSEGETIDHQVLDCIVGHLNFADARPQNGPINPDGRTPHTLFMPGSRSTMTQRDIAQELDCSEERVRLAIKQLKRCMILVNSGTGWYELDASFFWKGNEAIRLAYLPVQQELTGTHIVQLE